MFRYVNRAELIEASKANVFLLRLARLSRNRRRIGSDDCNLNQLGESPIVLTTLLTNEIFD